MEPELRTTNSLARLLQAQMLEKGWGLLFPLEDNRWKADLGDQLIRVRLALRLYRGQVTRPPRHLLLLQENH